jgi:hypothetical protein
LATFAKVLWQILPDLSGTFCQRFISSLRRNTVPLLKPPDPQVPKRKYYVRIEEPLALTLERYAQFIGASSVDHVIAQGIAKFGSRLTATFKSVTGKELKFKVASQSPCVSRLEIARP